MRGPVVVLAAAVALAVGACGGSPPLLPSSNASAEKRPATGIAITPRTYVLGKGVSIAAKNADGYEVRDQADKEAVATLAKALGVPGAVHTTSTNWTVGDGARQLTVSRRGGQAFSMYASGDVAGPSPTEASARRVATDAFDAGGASFSDQRIEAVTNIATVSVHFVPKFGAVTVTGFEGWVEVDGQNAIVNASGYLGRPDKRGSYRLASVGRAIERLNASQSSQAGDAGTISLTKAKLGLTALTDRQDTLWLVPAYVFGSDDGEEVTTQAVADDLLQAEGEISPSTTASGSDAGLTGGPCVTNAKDPGGSQANLPVVAEVCLSAPNFKAGDKVGFTISANDADRPFADGPCYDGVTVEYGDDTGGDVRCQACATSVGDDDDGADASVDSGQALRIREHVYAKAGHHTAIFTIKSGADCGYVDSHDSTATISVPVTIQ